MKFTFFFFNDTATTEIYTLSLHDALPISLNMLVALRAAEILAIFIAVGIPLCLLAGPRVSMRSEEHTSELQSQSNLVCRLLLEKKKTSYKKDKPTRKTTRKTLLYLRKLSC